MLWLTCSVTGGGVIGYGYRSFIKWKSIVFKMKDYIEKYIALFEENIDAAVSSPEKKAYIL